MTTPARPSGLPRRRARRCAAVAASAMREGQRSCAPASTRWRAPICCRVTPRLILLARWRGGALSGKYKRADKGKHQAGRGARVTNYLDDRTFDLLDLMDRIATELGTTGP